MIIKKV